MESGHLLNNLLLFGRILHDLGLNVNPGNLIEAMRALEVVEIGRKPDFYYTLRTILVQKKEDLPLFDEAFEYFWRNPEELTSVDLTLSDLFNDQSKPKPKPVATPPPLDESEDTPDPDGSDDDEERQTVIEITQTFSDREMLRQKDFEQMSPDELQQVKRLMAQLVWQLGQRKTRRLQIGKGRQINFRRSLRRNMRFGGEMLTWTRQTEKIKPRPLVIIADISGSMERYARLLIHFLYSLAGGLDQRVELFVFSTRLTRITRQMRNRDADRAIAEAATAIPDWGGGTRIGDALHTFNLQWGRRVLRGGAVTLVISDGWDRGEPALLGKEMERLKKTSHRVVWLNPLLGMDSYEPLTRGIVASLPYIDDFLPVNNLASLEDLAQHLALLDSHQWKKQKLRGAAFIGRT